MILSCLEIYKARAVKRPSTNRIITKYFSFYLFIFFFEPISFIYVQRGLNDSYWRLEKRTTGINQVDTIEQLVKQQIYQRHISRVWLTEEKNKMIYAWEKQIKAIAFLARIQ